MKAITNKKFTKEACNTIMNLNEEELETVRKGLYILYSKLKDKGFIEFGKLNNCACFLMDTSCTAACETMARIKKDEMPY